MSQWSTQVCRFHTITPGWIHIWRWNAQSLVWHRKGVLQFFLSSSVKFKVTFYKKSPFDPNSAKEEEMPYYISRSFLKFKFTDKKLDDFAFTDCNSLMATKRCITLDVAHKGLSVVFQCHLYNFKDTPHVPIVTPVWNYWLLWNDGHSLT